MEDIIFVLSLICGFGMGFAANIMVNNHAKQSVQDFKEAFQLGFETKNGFQPYETEKTEEEFNAEKYQKELYDQILFTQHDNEEEIEEEYKERWE